MKLFKSNLIYKRITEIKVSALNKAGINCLMLDVDNTLSTHHGTELVSGLNEWLLDMKEFGVRLMVVSNSKDWRIKPFAEKIGLDYVSFATKPLPRGYKKAIKKLGCSKNEVAIVGDQIFTDVLGANLIGIKSILVRPILLENKLSFKIRRYFEKLILKENF